MRLVQEVIPPCTRIEHKPRPSGHNLRRRARPPPILSIPFASLMMLPNECVDTFFLSHLSPSLAIVLSRTGVLGEFVLLSHWGRGRFVHNCIGRIRVICAGIWTRIEILSRRMRDTVLAIWIYARVLRVL